MRDLTAAAGITRYIALHDGVIAGGASFRMAGNIAQLTGAATAPAHRRRGIQSALLNVLLPSLVKEHFPDRIGAVSIGCKGFRNGRDEAPRRPAAVPAATQRSGKITLPSSASPNPGLCATSHTWPSRSRKAPA